MNTLYLECNMGAAGDMLMAALYELLEDKAGFLDTMNHLIPGVTVTPRQASTCGICGIHMEVEIHGETETVHDVACVHDHHDHADEHDHVHAHHDHEHEHEHHHDHGSHHNASPADIASILRTLPVPEEVRQNAQAVYHRIAEAESKAHGIPITDVHFHEVGALDAVADVTGVCLAMYLLRPDRVQGSPIHLGSGQVRCAHGVVPVPAPATARLLEGLPCYCGEISGELCTPTGAALLAHFCQSFGPMPVMTLAQVGYGVGTKAFPAANCVRAFWGKAGDSQQADIVELCCHIDDMTAEALSFAAERLLAQGALDVSSVPLTMKKGRAGTAFTTLCRPCDEERIAQAVLRETTSNGVRARRCKKYILTPSVRTAQTSYGAIRIKCADGEGIHHVKPEYDDVAAAAQRAGLPFQLVWQEILKQI